MRETIVVSENPLGHFIEGTMRTADGAFKPGQCCCIDPSAALLDGRPQYKIWDYSADGDRASVVIVRENDLIGQTVDTAYSAGDRFLGYIPGNGDEVQVLLKDVAGTGTSGGERPALGAKLTIDDGTGKVQKSSGTPQSEPFEVMELLSEPIAADTLILVRVTGV